MSGQREGFKEMATWVNGWGKLLPFLGMLMAMLTQSGSMVVIKFAMTDGMNKYVMVVYSMALSSSILLPFVLFLHRFSLCLSLFLFLKSIYIIFSFLSFIYISLALHGRKNTHIYVLFQSTS